MSSISATKVTHGLHSERANNTERKFNLVVYGIDECSQKTNHQLRAKQDLENAIKALSGADDEIEPSDVKDLYHLGKYDSKSEHPRPLIIKFLRSSVVKFKEQTRGTCLHKARSQSFRMSERTYISFSKKGELKLTKE